ncbi:MAG: glycosyl hydrolase [Sideroxydans sp.]|nr:glycosyl hydrolase [Sideroxydans sp.]
MRYRAIKTTSWLLTLALVMSCGGGSSGDAESSLGCGGTTSSTGATVQSWVTSADKSKLLARQPDLIFAGCAIASSHIDVNQDTHYQTMVGFGAAITDATAWVIQNKMSNVQRSALLDDLFGRTTGIGLSFIRLTIGASDFSLSHYSLDDMAAGQTDYPLTNFSIVPMRTAVLPTIQAALVVNPNISVMASPWSAPAWMKSSDSLVTGSLLPQAYDAYARYLVKFADAMQAEGIPLYALTAQNEPNFEPADYPGMLLDSTARATLVGQHLGPLLAQRATPLRLLDWDHNWDNPTSPQAVLDDATARPYVDGVAWHCYAGGVGTQTAVHDAYPDKETYFTECSGGDWASVWSDNLLWNTRTLVIGATRNWAKGVLLWNLALDENHGPHLGGCSNCRGVVTINSVTGVVTRNEEYYALAHASKFVRPGAQHIASSSGSNGLDSVAFRNADDGSLVLIVANAHAVTSNFTVRQGGLTFPASLPAGAVATYVWTP